MSLNNYCLLLAIVLALNIPPAFSLHPPPSSSQAGDLHGVEVFERLEVKGISTLQTAVVDYRGYRVVCQSIIPGVVCSVYMYLLQGTPANIHVHAHV